MQMTYRPLSAWPGQRTRSPKNSPFKASWGNTLEILDRELSALSARNVVLQVDLAEGKIRLDGMPYADAKPRGPAVILAFDSRVGPLRYAVDRFDHWQANVRAIALGLEALRRVDRYGIVRDAEQYKGWRALLPDNTSAAAPMTPQTAAAFLAEQAPDSAPADALLERCDLYLSTYRSAALRLHPDRGGSEALMARLNEAKAVLDRHFGG